MPHEQTAEIIRQMLFNGFRCGHTGQDRVASDPVFCFMNGNQLAQIIDGGFSGTLSNLRNIGDNPAHRGNVDDTAA